MTNGDKERPVLYFDGVCNLCNRWVQFVIRHDKKEAFLFASVQSATGQTAINNIKAATGESPDSIILFDNGKYYTRSGAVLRIAARFGGIWKTAAAGLLLPRLLRDGIYNFVARRRYKWFGKKETCMIPTPGLRSRFLT